MMSTTIVERPYQLRADFRRRLRGLIEQYGSVAELAAAVGVSDNAIYKWRQGRGEPSLSNAAALADACRVPLEWLATGRGPRSPHAARPPGSGEYLFVPRYHVRIPAGRGRPLRSDQVVDYLAFRADWVERRLGADPRNLILVEAVGDSMAPTFDDRDLLLVDLGEPRFRQDGVYVLKRDGDLAVKRLQRRHDGRIVIRSDNPAYQSVATDPSRVGVIGRVIWVAGRL
jgi:phage repressor protein C with HTH and peptisase S24 domain